MKNQFLLYGANGYTAKLIIPKAIEAGYQPILSGRTESKIKPLATKYKLPYRIIDLQDTATLDSVLNEVEVVLHCAGPFIHTARPMMEACIRTKTHYLDITGEIDVFEMGHTFDAQAKQQDIMIMPGTGFDVVPTDCMAAFLKNELPDATHLELAFAMKGGGLSHGTALTAVENLGAPNLIRKNGKITPVPMGANIKLLKFGKEFTSHGVAIPWGDVSTAYHNTGIPNIIVYTGLQKQMVNMMKMQRYFGWLMKTNFVKNIARNRINNAPAGPSPSALSKSITYIYGEVKNAAGATKSAYMVTPNGYALTAFMSLHIVKEVLGGNWKSGFQTPSMAYTSDLVLKMDGVKRISLL